MSKSAFKINTEWLNYNNFHNEGGEGYNPHKKWIVASDIFCDSATTTTGDDYVGVAKYVKDERGNLTPRAKMVKRLADDQARLAKITDKGAIALTQRAIDFAKSELGVV